ncbi:RNA polymerase sigma factor (sigma-70 family) [Enterococcus sp. PF1-24]|uniref:RNA polymerase sigma factor n=1 Tax=unclassified Enterococcus TaxID=2608891 RepID=UPI002476CE9E|nr:MULTISPECIES: sigma-70 family RNA polymerase sigma factor [unclassified Enterococcus]MDH6363897.1 RNA polymerase sigma factor (sigma-70 family) [Enterococcus sp. PFB1-1]MDH6400917.1 RNA polymerase sigma factor (sigma-70 family) [Enterococcus sp. PF1-24]
MEKRINDLIAKALAGEREALEEILVEVKDFVFNISLRMLGTIPDAEDATQEVLIKIITNLASFKMNAKFETWVYRITTNYLIDYKKSMFAQYPLTFTYYGNDIKAQVNESVEDAFNQEERETLTNELKLSCTNVMLQCLTPLNRCVFILGTMFKINSQWASEILGLSPQNYRQRLSRSRKKMQAFLFEHCEYAGGTCRCNQRIEYAIKCERLKPKNLEYTNLVVLDKDILEVHKNIMEDVEDQVDVFNKLPLYHAKVDSKTFISQLLSTAEVEQLLNFSQEG